MKAFAHSAHEERNESSRYELLVKLAAGGMGSVYVARGRGALGFENVVAVKRPHMHLLEAPEFREALIDEARIASKIRHANVVCVRDVAVEGALVYLVMDYVDGVSLAQLLRSDAERPTPPLPVGVATRIALDACAGLHAAHEARDDDGRLLDVVHRDVSPHNILLGTDGLARITDFGIAKCFATTKEHTQEGVVKGKIAYTAPEYIRGDAVDRRADVFALGTVMWELFTGKRLFNGNSVVEMMTKIAFSPIPRPREHRADLPGEIDAVIMAALAREPGERTPTAEALGESLERAVRTAGVFASHRDVAAHVKERFGEMLDRRAEAIRAAKSYESTIDLAPESAPATQTSSQLLPSTVPRPRAHEAPGSTTLPVASPPTMRSAPEKEDEPQPAPRTIHFEAAAGPSRETAASSTAIAETTMSRASRSPLWGAALGLALSTAVVGGGAAIVGKLRANAAAAASPASALPSVTQSAEMPPATNAPIADTARPPATASEAPPPSSSTSRHVRPPPPLATTRGAKPAASRPPPGPDVAPASSGKMEAPPNPYATPTAGP